MKTMVMFAVVTAMLFTVCVIGDPHPQALAGDESQLMLEMLNAVGKGLDSSTKMKECVGGNMANWSRCNNESNQRMNNYMQDVQRRTDEMTDRKLEEIAVDICKDEDDERAFERCVRKEMREMKRH